MSILETAILLAFGVYMFLFIFFVINAVHFYRVHYEKISEQIDGRKLDLGFLFSAMRFTTWGYYCLSRSLAKRDGVKEVFDALPQSARGQLMFHSSVVMLGGIIIVAGGIWMFLEEYL